MIELDQESLLVHASASEIVAKLEVELSLHGLTLDARAEATMTVGEWISTGARGARDPWLDPADHLVAGFTATFGDEPVSIRPAPRRATGPDLFALLFGQRGRVATLHDVWLRVHRVGVHRPRAEAFVRPDPEWTADEAGLMKKIEAELARRPG